MFAVYHILQLAAGIGAGAAALLFLHVLGLLLTPSRFAETRLDSPHPAILGAMATVLWCWFGIQLDFPLPTVMIVGLCAVALLLASRPPFLLQTLSNTAMLRQLLATFAVFATCYTIAYAFLPPSVSGEFLPISRNGNNDILNYLNYTTFLLHLEPSNVVDYAFRRTGYPVYEATPAVFYAIYGISTFFGGQPISAIMPTIFCAIGLIGCGFAWLSRIAFDLPRPVCLAIAALLVSGSFINYVVGNYFLSQLIGMAIVLLLLGETAQLLTLPAEPRFRRLLWRTLPYQVLLLFTYPVYCVLGSGLQLGLVVFFGMTTQPWNRRGVVTTLTASARWAAATVCGLAIAGLLDPGHLYLNVKFLALISKAGVAGWPQDLISPFAIVGLPGPVQLVSKARQLVFPAVYLAALMIVGYLLFRRRSLCPPLGKAFYVIGALSSLMYFGYFALVGPSYQQWKLASYLPLTMSFAIVAGTIAALTALFAPQGAALRGWRLSVILTGAVVLASANIGLHLAWMPRPERFSSHYSNLKALEALPNVKRLFVDMDNYSSTFFPVYFIRNKLLHLVSPSYYSKAETVKPEDISPATPLLLEGDVCAADKHRAPIKDVGCVFFRRPAVKPNHRYEFGKRLVELAGAPGLGARESWGRWSSGKKVTIPLFADPEDIAKLPAGFINFQLTTFLLHPLTAQTALIKWGQERSWKVAISAAGWISLPVSADDWDNGELRKIEIEFELPDAISPKQVDPKYGDDRVMALGFVAMSWTKDAAGMLPKEPDAR